MKTSELKSYTSTRNACKLCAPLGASVVFRGIEGSVPLLHGSQGCSTYVRRYLISHFKEPVDVASSNFAEASAVFGGGENLRLAIENVVRQYRPRLIGIATTCLSETIGEDVPRLLRELNGAKGLPLLVPVSTPSYSGTHMDGFHAAIKAVVEQVSGATERHSGVNLFPGFVSPADLRYLREIFADFGLALTLLPDYADTLDGPAWDRYHVIPEGGTRIADIERMGGATASLEFGRTIASTETAAQVLFDRWGVERCSLGLPVGVGETDRFFALLERLSGRGTPEKYRQERGRLLDSYFDGHKYVFEKKAVVYGEEDFVVGMASFLAEIGIVPVLCASGGESGCLKESVAAVAPSMKNRITVREGVDFMSIGDEAERRGVDLLIGSSKGYPLARRLKVPLVRAGFPVHDRIGGQRLLHLGYRGAQALFDRTVNTLIERRQDDSAAGYMYM